MCQLAPPYWLCALNRVMFFVCIILHKSNNSITFVCRCFLS